jgi:hypothetical protein
VHRALSPDPASRFGSARELEALLDSLLGRAGGPGPAETCAQVVHEVRAAAPGWTGVSPLDWPEDLSGSTTHLVAAVDPASQEQTAPGAPGQQIVRKMTDSQRLRALQEFSEAENTETRSVEVTITEARALPTAPPGGRAGGGKGRR